MTDKKRRARPPKKGGHHDLITSLFRRQAGIPDADGSKLLDILPKGITPLTDVAAEAMERFGDEGEPTELHPRDIVELLADLPAPSVRRDVRELLAGGVLEQDEEGRYRLAVDPEVDEGEELGRWLKWVRDAAVDAGWESARVVEFDDIPHVIRHSPNHGKRSRPVSRKLPPSVGGGSGAALSPVASFSPRELRMSWDDELGREIPVIATPMWMLEIIDYDARDEREPPRAFASAPTPNGYHFYRRWPQVYWGYQDAQFVASSRARGVWHERLFNDDGTRRSPPTCSTPNLKDFGLTQHIARAWRTFQEEAERRGLHRERTPGEDDE
jgi:hypothetical protein